MKSKIAIVFFAALSLMCVSNCMPPIGLVLCNITYKIGPYNGVVLDSATRQPIKGAKVYVVAEGEQFSWDSVIYPWENDSKWKKYLTETDEQGHYNIPVHFMRSCKCINCGGRSPTLIIYKSGYVGYRNDQIFMGGPVEGKRTQPRKDFKKKDNVVLLEKWDDNKFTWSGDHSVHIHFFLPCDISSPSKLLCGEAKDEMMFVCVNSENINPKRCEEIINRGLNR